MNACILNIREFNNYQNFKKGWGESIHNQLFIFGEFWYKSLTYFG